jgi:hypothetical protein
MVPRRPPQGTERRIGWLEPPAPTRVVRRPFLFALLLQAGIISPLAGQTSQAQLPSWISTEPTSRTLTISLEVERAGPEGAARLNGHHHGSVQLVVPLGWTVQWTWSNRDSTERHSLVVMAEREKMPTEGGRPALENAMTRAVTAGLKPGQKDLTTFIADQAGWYWMLCGVPGHAILGEWIGLKVDRKAQGVEVVVKD